MLKDGSVEHISRAGVHCIHSIIHSLIYNSLHFSPLQELPYPSFIGMQYVYSIIFIRLFFCSRECEWGVVWTGRKAVRATESGASSMIDVFANFAVSIFSAEVLIESLGPSAISHVPQAASAFVCSKEMHLRRVVSAFLCRVKFKGTVQSRIAQQRELAFRTTRSQEDVLAARRVASIAGYKSALAPGLLISS
jgi:hypothetical protein